MRFLNRRFLIVLLTLGLVSCGDQVVRETKPNRFVVTVFDPPIGPNIYTYQDTSTDKCWIGVYEMSLLETSKEVCE